MFARSYKICKILGIPVRIHISLILLMLITAVFIARDSGLKAVPVILGVQLALFISIALHELGHSYVAQRYGCRVRDITLMIIGGAAQMEDIPKRPWQEIIMAAAGPMVSLILAIALFFGGARLPLRTYYLSGGSGLSINYVQLIGIINATLAGFNLLPAFPTDGGRILRAALSMRLGRRRATDIAATVGKGFAVLLVLYGFIIAKSFWPLLIAGFIWMVGEQERRMEAMRSRFGFDNGVDDDVVIIAPPPYLEGNDIQKRTLYGPDRPFWMDGNTKGNNNENNPGY